MSEPANAAKPIDVAPVAAAAVPVSAPDPLIGRLLADRFLLQALIARGGMGKVYRAEQHPLGRQCAVKVLNPKYVGDHDPDFARRFFLEATIASKLTHPNTVTIFDYGQTDDGIFYMAMELLEGETLHRAIKTTAPFPALRVAHIGRQICRSLREAHNHGVIHRDLKPANVFLTEHGDEADFVKVLDFGLVKNLEGPMEDLTETGLFMGSPKYMAPEAIRGEAVDARGDIYSLGVILYEMTCGKVPFDRANSLGTLMAHVNDQPPPLEVMCPGLEVPPELSATIFACLEKEPEHRLHSMEEVLIALKQLGPSGTHGMTGEFRSVQPPSVRLSVPSRTSRSSHPPPSASGQQIARERDVAARLSRSSSRMEAARAAETGADLVPSDAETKAIDRDGSVDEGETREPLISGIATKAGEADDAHADGEPSAALPLVSQVASVASVASASSALAASSARRTMHPAVWALVGGALVALISALGVARRYHPAVVTPVAPATAATATATTEVAPSASASASAPESPNVPTVAVNSLPNAGMVLRVTSEPSGATIREGDVELCTATPCDITFRGAGNAATDDANAAHKLTAVHAGYATTVTTVHASDGSANVKLGPRVWAPATNPSKGRPAAGSPAAPSPSPGAGNAATPANGFKGTPY